LAQVSKTHKPQHHIKPTANSTGGEEQGDKGPERPVSNRNCCPTLSRNRVQLHFGILTGKISES
jgi:hypothetical protein